MNILEKLTEKVRQQLLQTTNDRRAARFWLAAERVVEQQIGSLPALVALALTEPETPELNKLVRINELRHEGEASSPKNVVEQLIVTVVLHRAINHPSVAEALAASIYELDPFTGYITPRRASWGQAA